MKSVYDKFIPAKVYDMTYKPICKSGGHMQSVVKLGRPILVYFNKQNRESVAYKLVFATIGK